jgi:hypothetical protein
MHMVISNAACADPYGIDVLFMYMANMAWNSSMNTPAVMEMLTDKDETGEYVIPKIIYSDAYYSEMVAYADLILPDTTYLERMGLHLAARPADLGADMARRRDPLPVVEPDRDVRGFQTCCSTSARGWACRAWSKDGWQPVYPGGYADYIVNHERKPGIGPLAGWRGEDGDKTGGRSPTRTSSSATSRTAASGRARVARAGALFQARQQGLERLGDRKGIGFNRTQADHLPALFEPLRKFRLAARGHGTVLPPEHTGSGSGPVSTRCPSGIRRLRAR